MMASVIPRVLFYPTLGYNVFMSKVTSRNWFNRVDDTVIIGALPFRKLTKQLVDKENVKAVLSLNESYELKLSNSPKEWEAVGVEHLRLSTIDLIGTAPAATLKMGVDFILSHRSKGDSVYVHCKAGRTRSAMYVVCYLMQVNNWNPQKAYAHLKTIRPHVWLRHLQLESVNSYYDEYVNVNKDH